MSMQFLRHTSLLLCVTCCTYMSFVWFAQAQESTESPVVQESSETVASESEAEVVIDNSSQVELGSVTDEVSVSPEEVVAESTGDGVEAVQEVEPTELVAEEVQAVDERAIETTEAIEVQESLAEEELIEVKETLVEAAGEEGGFVLVSTTTFAINEVPEFVFTKSVQEGFIESAVSAVTETVADLYAESFVETVVDAIVEATQTVVDFLVPQAEGQAPTPEEVTLSSTPSPSETESVPISDVPQGEQEVVIPSDTTTSEEVDAVTMSSESPESTEATTQTATTSVASTTLPMTVPPLPYAVVDGVFVPVTVTHGEQTLTVRLEGVFAVGEHAVFVHVLDEETELVLPLVFTVKGTVLLEQSLFDTYFVQLTQDGTGFKTLWLVNYASGTVKSFEKITDGEYVGEGMHYTFENETLFWSIPALEVMMGYDVISKNMFSQTLTMHGSQKNFIDLEEGRAEIHIEDGAVDLTRVISATP